MGATESKMAFRKGVFRLFEQRNIPSTAVDFWSQFWSLPTSADDVFALVTTQDIRRVRDQAPENLVTLVEKLVSRATHVMHSPGFPSPVNPSSHLLNCTRILTRLLPYLFELDDEGHFENELFWSSTDSPSLGVRLVHLTVDLLFLTEYTLPRVQVTSRHRINYMIWANGIGQRTAPALDGAMQSCRIETLRLLLVLLSKSMYGGAHAHNPWIETLVGGIGLGKKVTLALLCSLINTVSAPGLTPRSQSQKPGAAALSSTSSSWNLPYEHMWMPGDGKEREGLLVALSTQLLLVLLDYTFPSPTSGSGSVPSSPRAPSSPRSPSSQRPVSPRALMHQARRESVTGRKSPLPGPSSPSLPPPGGDQGSGYAELEIKVEEGEDTSLNPTPPTPTARNVFRVYVSRLHREEDFSLILRGFLHWMSQPVRAHASYLPGSEKPISFQQEMIMTFWLFLRLNSRFKAYALREGSADLVGMLLCTALMHKMDSSRLPQMTRMGAFGCADNPGLTNDSPPLLPPSQSTLV